MFRMTCSAGCLRRPPEAAYTIPKAMKHFSKADIDSMDGCAGPLCHSDRPDAAPRSSVGPAHCLPLRVRPRPERAKTDWHSHRGLIYQALIDPPPCRGTTAPRLARLL